MAEPELQIVFERMSEAAMAILPMRGPMGKAAEVASVAFGAAAKMVEAGLDPAVEFTRIHGADPMIQALAKLAEDRFPQTQPPLAPAEAEVFSAPPTLRDLFDDPAEESRP